MLTLTEQELEKMTHEMLLGTRPQLSSDVRKKSDYIAILLIRS